MSQFTAGDASLDHYISDLKRYPVLSREEEVELAERYRDHSDAAAEQRLVVSNLRFVVKTAHEYRGYGLKLLDLIQEGNIGLMLAVKKFDPSRGYRLVSYAVWWIRAYIQSYIMRSWSLIKVGTTQAQRKLFFRLRSARQEADRAAGPGEHVSAEELAIQLHVNTKEVTSMEARLGERDFSLDAKVAEGGKSSHVDMLASGGQNQEEELCADQLRDLLRLKVREVSRVLNDKERYVIEHRILCEEPPTLQEVGTRLKISRERVRQLEGNVVRKLRTAFNESGVPTMAA